MSKTVYSAIQALLASDTKSQPVKYDWRLIRRRGRPFMLLSSRPALARSGLNLYSAQRRRAKVWRRILPVLFQTPIGSLFELIRFQADGSAEFVQFMAKQAGIPADQVFPAAIKLSETGAHSRLVVLLCDESGRPTRVIKVGLDSAGRAATDREADCLAELPPGKLGCTRMTGRLSAPNFSAFSMDYFPGTSPYDDAGLEHLFHDWLNKDATVPLESLTLWRELSAAVASSPLGSVAANPLRAGGKKHPHHALSRRLCAMERSRDQFPQFAGLRLGTRQPRGDSRLGLVSFHGPDINSSPSAFR